MRRDLRDFRWRAGLTELNLRGRYRFEKLDPWIMIDALRAGRYLPDQLIEQLPICWGPESPSYPSEYDCDRRRAR